VHLSSQESFCTQDNGTDEEFSDDKDEEVHTFFVCNGYRLSKEAFALLKELSPEILEVYMKALQEQQRPHEGNASSPQAKNSLPKPSTGKITTPPKNLSTEKRTPIP